MSLLGTEWFGYGAIYLYWRLPHCTGDAPVEYGVVYLYWGRCGMVCRCRSLLGTYWWSSSLKMFTGDGVIGNVAVDLHLGRCGRELNDRSLLGTVW